MGIAVWAGWLRRPQSGLALLESAMAFPLLLMTSLAIMQLGLWGHEQTVVTGSVQEGARVAAADNRNLKDGVDYAQSLLQAGIGRDAQGVSLTGTDLGDAVAIEAQGRMHLILPWIADATLPLAARSVISKEQFRVPRTS